MEVNTDAGNDGIGGTSFKTPEALAEGYANLKTLHDKQANELGTVRKEHESAKGQVETLSNIIKDGRSKSDKPAAAAGPDYGAEITAIQKQIENLDPMDDKYQTSLSSLLAKSNKLVALDQHEKTLSAAGDMFKQELSDRDSKAARDSFLSSNPDFDTPEMQAQIKEYIAKDKTGMSDSLSAYREIQRDQLGVEAKRLADENAEYKKRLDLAKGTESTGKVIVKGQSPGQQTTQSTKVTGKDLDAGMLAALRAQPR